MSVELHSDHYVFNSAGNCNMHMKQSSFMAASAAIIHVGNRVGRGMDFESATYWLELAVKEGIIFG